MKSSYKELGKVFAAFFRIGAFTFGGGIAMIPLIQKEAAEKNKWVTDDDILEVIAIAESTPGPIAINAATFVGHRACGILGSIVATLGVVLPSFLIILLLSFLIRQFQALSAVQYAFHGIRAGVLALLCKSLFTMYKKSPKGLVSYIAMAGAFILTAFTPVNVIFVVIGCGIFGLLSSLYLERRGGK